MKLTYKKGTVEISVRKSYFSNEYEMKTLGDFRICQEIPFAFRRVVDILDGDVYEITHVPSGFKLPVIERLGEYFKTFKNTRKFLEALADQNIDWNFTDVKDCEPSMLKYKDFLMEYQV